MKATVSLPVLRRILFTGLLVLNLACGREARGDVVTADYAPSYLAERLGLAQKATIFAGLPVREKAGRKIGHLEDAVVDLHSGRVLCGLVTIGDGATIALPGKIFSSIDEKAAVLTLNDVHPDTVPRAATADIAALINSLPDSYKHFGEPICWEVSTPPTARKCRKLIGSNVRNSAGESLGHVVNLVVDLPTARVVFVVVSLAGKGTDLYAVPPQAFRTVENAGFVLDMDKSKISSLAQSDGFFWSNMAEASWSANVYHTFGTPADFDSPSDVTPGSLRVNARTTVQPIKLTLKPDRELSEDILTAMMHDNLNNPFIYKNARIKTLHGQVTLSGSVKNEELHGKLVALVSSVVGPTNIHDELKIK